MEEESIIYPSRVISDQYDAKIVVTLDGLTHTGIVGTGGEGELIVLQADGTKVPVREEDIEEILPSKVSAMPEGLLDSLSLKEVADLISFLEDTPTVSVTRSPARD